MADTTATSFPPPYNRGNYSHAPNQNQNRERERVDRGGGRGGGAERGRGGGGVGYRGGGGGDRGRGYRGGGGGGYRGGYHNHRPAMASARPKNRFTVAEVDASTQPYRSRSSDPHQSLRESLRHMIVRVGHIPLPPPPQYSHSHSHHHESLETQQALKIQQLIPILQKNEALFFYHHPAGSGSGSGSGSHDQQPQADDDSIQSPPSFLFATTLVQALAVMPLQTPCYTALFLRIASSSAAVRTTTSASSSSGLLVQAILEEALRVLAHQLDQALLVTVGGRLPGAGSSLPPPRALIACQCRLLLRFFMLAARDGHHPNHNNDNDNNSDENHHHAAWLWKDPDPENPDHNHSLSSSRRLTRTTFASASSMQSLLLGLVQAAENAAAAASWAVGVSVTVTTSSSTTQCQRLPQLQQRSAALLLAQLVLSTLLYYYAVPPLEANDNGMHKAWLSEHVVEPLHRLIHRRRHGPYSHYHSSSSSSSAADAGYRSLFTPGIGCCAILLRHEQDEIPLHDEENAATMEEEDDDIDDDIDDEEDEGSKHEEDEEEVCCDHLQDLLRTVRHYIPPPVLSSPSSASAPAIILPPKFKFLSDQPWRKITATTRSAPDDRMIQEQDENETTTGSSTGVHPRSSDIAYSGPPFQSRLFPACCRSLTSLLPLQEGRVHGEGGGIAGTAPASSSSSDGNGTLFHPNCLMGGGVVTGRLPFFGPPPDLKSDDEDDEDAEDDMDDDQSRFHAYQHHMGMVDRYLVAESVRDILLCHESIVSDTGMETSSAKAVAETIWAMALHVVPHETTQSQHNHQPLLLLLPGMGLEYCIVETLITLIVQADHDGDRASSTSSPFQFVYVSRVLLELTRLAPTVIAPALALGVQILFDDYMPTLTPHARNHLATWLAYHLIHTQYQWPAAYWLHWTPFVLHGYQNSRGQFVQSILAHLVENVSRPADLVRTCLPPGSPLVAFLVPSSAAAAAAPPNTTTTPNHHHHYHYYHHHHHSKVRESAALSAFVDVVQTRLWTQSEDPALLLSYVTSSSTTTHIMGPWFRTTATVRAICAPALREGVMMRQAIVAEVAQQPQQQQQQQPPQQQQQQQPQQPQKVDEKEEHDDTTMQEDREDVGDTMEIILDVLKRYHVLLKGVIAQDMIADHNHNINNKREEEEEERTLLERQDMMVVSGEMIVLQELEAATVHSRSLLECFVQHLLQNETIGPLSVIRWCLSDHRLDSEGGVVMIDQWWVIAMIAMDFAERITLPEQYSPYGMNEMNENQDDMVDDMNKEEIDESAVLSAPLKRGRAMIRKLQPFLVTVMNRVTFLLKKDVEPLQQQGQANKRRRPRRSSPCKVECMEGMKRLMLRTRSLYMSEIESASGYSSSSNSSSMSDSDHVTTTAHDLVEARQELSKSSISGARLAQPYDAVDNACCSELVRMLKRFDALDGLGT